MNEKKIWLRFTEDWKIPIHIWGSTFGGISVPCTYSHARWKCRSRFRSLWFLWRLSRAVSSRSHSHRVDRVLTHNAQSTSRVKSGRKQLVKPPVKANLTVLHCTSLNVWRGQGRKWRWMNSKDGRGSICSFTQTYPSLDKRDIVIALDSHHGETQLIKLNLKVYITVLYCTSLYVWRGSGSGQKWRGDGGSTCSFIPGLIIDTLISLNFQQGETQLIKLQTKVHVIAIHCTSLYVWRGLGRQ